MLLADWHLQTKANINRCGKSGIFKSFILKLVSFLRTNGTVKLTPFGNFLKVQKPLTIWHMAC
ncbi:hypothetical protein DERF_004648 [Dermatophagoides farinae]|uniref:Uncharacterized protein n=1 Tax=Dermatophagoides farinae TaxID=6954 RepID=A0A922L6E7_DERFA|nr:hypothetical protein DERF_004648 [Dermatophagoides farinae]